MRKKILGATFVVAMAAIAGYNTYVNQTKVEMSDMALANVEALAEDNNLPEYSTNFYSITYVNLCQMGQVTSVSGNLNSGIKLGNLINPLKVGELEVKAGVNIEYKLVDCHKRECLATSEPQTVECREDPDWLICNTQCKHNG